MADYVYPCKCGQLFIVLIFNPVDHGLNPDRSLHKSRSRLEE
jgi:hypothetical protein